MKKLQKDYRQCSDAIDTVLQSERYINLGLYAKMRNVVSSGTVGLQELVLVTLKESLSKDPTIRLSSWSRVEAQ